MDRNCTRPEHLQAGQGVALRKESVDRNIWPVAYDATGHGRSPQGERG